jgi:hypothetical protein
MRRLLLCTVLVGILAFSSVVQANLVNNGGGFIYDEDLDITWYDAPPVLRDWSGSMSWAAGLTVGSTTAGTWYLPATPGTVSYVPTSEGQMGHLYYTELGKPAGGPLGATSFFTNLRPYGYWSGTECAPFGPPPTWAFFFNFKDGYQEYAEKYGYLYGLAVHDGNIGPNGPVVPIPGALWLLGSGLVGLAGLRRRMRK